MNTTYCYRISIYDSPSVWAAMLTREYIYCENEQDAIDGALQLCSVNPNYHYTVTKVKEVI